MALHDGLLELHGQAPYGIEVRWVYGPPLPLGLDPEAREAMVRERIARIFERMSMATGHTAGGPEARASRLGLRPEPRGLDRRGEETSDPRKSVPGAVRQRDIGDMPGHGNLKPEVPTGGAAS